MSWRKIIGLSAALLFLVGVLLWTMWPAPLSVEVAVIARGEFEQTIDEDGKTRVRERYVVTAPLAGSLRRVQLKAGDEVQRGDVLAEMTPSLPTLLDVRVKRELQERVGAAGAVKLRATAAVARAAAALKQARADLKRARELLEKNFISAAQVEHTELEANLKTKELELAEFDDHVAEHQLAEARAALSRLQDKANGKGVPATWKILSPVQGQVLKVLRESEGDIVVGEPILEVADVGLLEVVVDVLSSDAVQIPAAAKVWLERYGGGLQLEGRVRRIEPAAYTKISALGVEEQRVNVIIDIVSPPEQWRALGDGYKIEARIVVMKQDNVLRVPYSALFREGEQWYTYVVEQGRASKRPVNLGRRSGTQAVVEQGVTEGEQVILYPGSAVQDGARVALAKRG